MRGRCNWQQCDVFSCCILQKSRRKSVTTTTTTTTTSTSGDDDDDEDGDDDNDKESRTATRRSASQASTGSPMKKSAKKEQSSQNSKNGGKKSASSKNKRSTNSLKENSGEYLGMDGGTNNINRKQKQTASIATNLNASTRCVPDKTYGMPKTSMTAQQTAVNEKSKSESLHNGTSSPLRKVNRTPSGVSAANKNSKNRKTDILNRAIGEILKAGKNSSPSHLSRSAKKSSSSGVKFVKDDFDEDLADVEDELDEDEDYKSLKVKKSKKKLSSNQEKEKISSAVLNGKKSNASALLTSQKRLSSDKKSVNGNSDGKKQTVAAVTTISPKTTTVSNNSSPTKKKQSPVEVISSSYTLKPVYRRAAANKASDKIAKEASKATKNSDEDLSELSSDCDGDKDQKHQTTKQPNHRINSRYGHHLHFFPFFLSYPTHMSRCHRLVR